MSHMVAGKRGFSIIELTVVMVILSVVVLSLLAGLVTMLGEAHKNKVRTEMNQKLEFATTEIDRGVRFSTEYLRKLPSEYNDYYGYGVVKLSSPYDWDMSGQGAGDRALILEQTATTTHPMDGGNSFSYLDVDDGWDCSDWYLVQRKPRIKYNSVFFVRDGNLYRRYVSNLSLNACPGYEQYIKTTCPPEINVASDPNCYAHDEILARNVTRFDIDYYRNNNNNPPVPQLRNVYSSGNTIASAVGIDSILVTMEMEHGDVVSQKMIRMSRE